jgi:hypothetical protein
MLEKFQQRGDSLVHKPGRCLDLHFLPHLVAREAFQLDDPVAQIIDSRCRTLIPIICSMGRATGPTMGDPGPRPNTAGRPVAPRPPFLRLLGLPTFVDPAFLTGIRAPEFLFPAPFARVVWRISFAPELVLLAFLAS